MEEGEDEATAEDALEIALAVETLENNYIFILF